MSRVLIVQRRLTHYRVPFFARLRSELAARNVELVLAHGDPSSVEAKKGDEGTLSWARHLGTTYFLGGAVCWQPFSKLAKGCDLVVLTHENKLVNNLAVQFLSTGESKVALWGHGANFQGSASSLRERFKRRTARQADWWFGYSEASRNRIEQSGFPGQRITIVNNAIDSLCLAKQAALVQSDSLDKLRREFRLSGANVGIFVGSLYAEKRMTFLFEAALAIRERCPDFELLVVGDGPERSDVEAFCTGHSWAKYLGVRKGQQKADVLALSKVLLNPGGVGLGVIDSFVCGIPLVTTDCGLHGPEIAYLDSGTNGVVTANDLTSYVGEVERVLIDSQYRHRLQEGCAGSAVIYTIENMAARFSDGVEQCLSAPGYRRRA